MSDGHHLGTGQQLALVLQAGTHLFCAAGSVRLVVPGMSLGLPLSLELGPGGGWHAFESTRVLLLAHAPSRMLVTQEQRPRKSPAWRGFPDGWWRPLRRARPAA